MSDTPDLRNTKSNVQWGGRFAAGPSVVMQEINASIGFDRKMWRQDIAGSRAHAAMLAATGIIGAEGQTRRSSSGLDQVSAEIERRHVHLPRPRWRTST